MKNSVLYQAISANVKKLEDGFYAPDELALNKNYGWPGDWPGRALLAEVWQWRLTGKKPMYLEEMLAKLPSMLNEDGYFGERVDVGNINEQQLAGNSWYLRALCLYYLTDEGAWARELIEKTVKNLYLPVSEGLEAYPLSIDPTNVGGKEGCILRQADGWRLSSDVGCMFISLDGLAHAYEICPSEELYALFMEMAQKLNAVDVVACGYQTHATLTATRGLLKMYALTENPFLLSLAEKLWSLYLSCGITATYANYNWFNRPLWTEPCAIVDSFMVAKQLFSISKNEAQAVLACKIMCNALFFAERENGGFGCDSCASKDIPELFIDRGAYDAFWCCSMRGAEGLAEMQDFSYSEKGKTLRIMMPLPCNEEFFGGALSLCIEGDYPFAGKITVRTVSDGRRTLKVFLPYDRVCFSADVGATRRGSFYEWTPAKGESTVEINYSAAIRERIFEGKAVLEEGLLVLGEPMGEGREAMLSAAPFVRKREGAELIPLPVTVRFGRETAEKFRLKIIREVSVCK